MISSNEVLGEKEGKVNDKPEVIIAVSIVTITINQ